MKYRLSICPIALIVSAAPWLSGAVQADPPRVVKAIPDHGDTEVDPKLREIRVTFDQDMSPGGQSLCGGGPGFPEITGKARWVGRRTFVIPVRLKPNHSYSLSINCQSFRNFRGADGESAEIYPISFRTGTGRATDKPARLRRSDNVKAVKELWRLIDESYSYRDLRDVNWKAQFRKYNRRLKEAKTAAQFARTAAHMLAPAKDVHLNLRAGDVPFATYRPKIRCNYNLDALPRLVPQWKEENDFLASGRYNDDIGYLLIRSWSMPRPEMLLPAFDVLNRLADTRALIIDVRPNGGGDELFAREFAGSFVTESSVYARNEYRDPSAKDGFGKRLDRVIEPNHGRPLYKGRVVVLSGQNVMSSCESFLLMMKQAPDCTLVGETSFGSSGNPKAHRLANGVTALVPSWRDMLPDGTLLEGRGVEPDIAVRARPEDFDRSDPVLAAALKFLRDGKDSPGEKK